MKRTAAALSALTLLLASGAAAQSEASEPDAKLFFVEGAFGAAAAGSVSPTVLPERAEAAPVGFGLAAAGGVVLGWLAVGPRFSWDLHFDASRIRTLLGQLEARGRFAGTAAAFWIGFGYAWHDDLDLRRLGLGRFDGGGFALGLGPRLNWSIARDTTLGVGFRNHVFVATRPALGACTDEHGCDGVFYPDERAKGAMLSLGLEVVLGRDL